MYSHRTRSFFALLASGAFAALLTTSANLPVASQAFLCFGAQPVPAQTLSSTTDPTSRLKYHASGASSGKTTLPGRAW